MGEGEGEMAVVDSEWRSVGFDARVFVKIILCVCVRVDGGQMAVKINGCDRIKGENAVFPALFFETEKMHKSDAVAETNTHTQRWVSHRLIVRTCITAKAACENHQQHARLLAETRLRGE